MPVLRFAPYRVIAQEVASRLLAARGDGDPLAPWDEEVIVPSRGVAEAIASELLTRRPEGIAALRIQTLEDLAQRLLASAGRTPRVASDAERRLAMRTAVRSVDHPLMESRGVAAMLERGYRDVRDSGITLAELSKRVSRARGLRDAPRTAAVIRAWSEYERLVAKLNAIDGADRFAEASALPFDDVRPQLLAGFYDVTGAQWNLIEALLRSARITAMWVPTEEPFADRFIRRLTPFADVVRDPIEIAKHDAHATRYDTRDAELRDACDRIRELLDHGTPAHEIGIVARSLDPHDVRLLNRFAAERAFATTLPQELPLAAHRIGRGATTLLRLRERNFPRADVLELLRDGLLVRTQLNADAADEATRRARIAGGTSEELQRIRRRPPIVETYISLVAELEQLTATIDLDFISRLGAMFRIASDIDLAAAERLDEIAAVFQRASVWNQPLDPAAVLDAIEQESLTQKSSGAPMIWAGELLRFRGRSFSHLFVVRMQDDVFPQRRTPDPLLPDSDRERLGLPVIGDGREEESLLFSLLGDSASHVHHSFAAGDGFGKVLRPSRFLRTIPTQPQQTPAEISIETPPSPNIRRQLQRLARTGTSSAFDGYIGSVRAVPPLSPTQLEDFGECPQKFLVKHVLGARDIDDPEHELQINIRDKGTYDHRILERFYSSLTTDDFARAAASRSELPPDLADRLEQCIEEEFARLEEDSPAFNATVRGIERRATSRILRDFVIEDIADLDARGLAPKSFEYRFGTKHGDDAAHPDPFIIETNGSRVLVEGTIDRIDTNGTHYRIVDYKSGKAFRHRDLGNKIDRGVRLQLALYAMAVAEFFEASAENVSAAIRPLVVSDENRAQFEFALHEKRDGLLKTLAIFIAAIKRGDFPAFPDDDEINSCKYCPVNHSCRTRHDADERYAMAQHKDPRTLLGGGDE